jgi:hypothetical protein
MNDRPFIKPMLKPDDKTLRIALGKVFPFYSKILKTAVAFPHEWAFSKSSGWMLKIHDKKKALLYLIPLAGGLRISLTMREDERALLMADSTLKGMNQQIWTARKYSEGYALVFEIRSDKEFKPFDAFLKKLIALRG